MMQLNVSLTAHTLNKRLVKERRIWPGEFCLGLKVNGNCTAPSWPHKPKFTDSGSYFFPTHRISPHYLIEVLKKWFLYFSTTMLDSCRKSYLSDLDTGTDTRECYDSRNHQIIVNNFKNVSFHVHSNRLIDLQQLTYKTVH